MPDYYDSRDRRASIESFGPLSFQAAAYLNAFSERGAVCFFSLAPCGEGKNALRPGNAGFLSLDLSLGPIVAAGDFLVPFAVRVFPGNGAGLPWHVLFGGGDKRGATRRLMRGKCSENAPST